MPVVAEFIGTFYAPGLQNGDQRKRLRDDKFRATHIQEIHSSSSSHVVPSGLALILKWSFKFIGGNSAPWLQYNLPCGNEIVQLEIVLGCVPLVKFGNPRPPLLLRQRRRLHWDLMMALESVLTEFRGNGTNYWAH